VFSLSFRALKLEREREREREGEQDNGGRMRADMKLALVNRSGRDAKGPKKGEVSTKDVAFERETLSWLEIQSSCWNSSVSLAWQKTASALLQQACRSIRLTYFCIQKDGRLDERWTGGGGS
jgi:hypothetical protein